MKVVWHHLCDGSGAPCSLSRAFLLGVCSQSRLPRLEQGRDVPFMRVLVGCEESAIVRDAFRDLGHDAWSCDLLPTRGNPEWHYMCDVREVLGFGWDLAIFFPPCDDLAVSGARWFPAKRADGRQQRSVDFFLSLATVEIPLVAVENPIGIMSRLYRKPDQIVQPWMFGHGETKATCLWLRGLPLLVSTSIVPGREPRIWRLPPSPLRKRIRSETFPGIANAMASQWGRL